MLISWCGLQPLSYGITVCGLRGNENHVALSVGHEGPKGFSII